ncbi:MAG: hypothetical protein RR954_09860, partial [Christensenellaceae bacterium]
RVGQNPLVQRQMRRLVCTCHFFVLLLFFISWEKLPYTPRLHLRALCTFPYTFFPINLKIIKFCDKLKVLPQIFKQLYKKSTPKGVLF